MTDLEITRLCAEAMGYRVTDESDFAESGLWCHLPAQHGEWYRPLSGDKYGDSQAMALVKKFRLHINWWPTADGECWQAQSVAPDCTAKASDLNRAICECVAKLKQGEPDAALDKEKAE